MCFSCICPSETDSHHTTQKPLVSHTHNDPPTPTAGTSSIKRASVKSDENTLKSALSCLPAKQRGECDEYTNAQKAQRDCHSL